MVTVECQMCGEPFETYACRVEAGRGKYCGRECYARAKTKPGNGKVSRRERKRRARKLNDLVDDVATPVDLVYDPTDSLPAGWGRYLFYDFRDSLVVGLWPDGSVWRVEGVGDVLVEGRKVRPLGQRRDRFYYHRKSSTQAIFQDREGRSALAA